MKRGTVVLVRFPFSDLSASKRRPAVVLAHAGRGDHVLAQITSNAYADDRAIELAEGSFADGGLDRLSFVRPGKLFTANEAIIVRSVGTLTRETSKAAAAAAIRVLSGSEAGDESARSAPRYRRANGRRRRRQ